MENNKTTENQISFEIEMTSTALGKSVEKKNISFEEILKIQNYLILQINERRIQEEA